MSSVGGRYRSQFASGSRQKHLGTYARLTFIVNSFPHHGQKYFASWSGCTLCLWVIALDIVGNTSVHTSQLTISFWQSSDLSPDPWHGPSFDILLHFIPWLNLGSPCFLLEAKLYENLVSFDFWRLLINKMVWDQQKHVILLPEMYLQIFLLIERFFAKNAIVTLCCTHDSITVKHFSNMFQTRISPFFYMSWSKACYIRINLGSTWT